MCIFSDCAFFSLSHFHCSLFSVLSECMVFHYSHHLCDFSLTPSLNCYVCFRRHCFGGLLDQKFSHWSLHHWFIKIAFSYSLITNIYMKPTTFRLRQTELNSYYVQTITDYCQGFLGGHIWSHHPRCQSYWNTCKLPQFRKPISLFSVLWTIWCSISE